MSSARDGPAPVRGVRLLDGGAYLRRPCRATRRVRRRVFASSTEASICGNTTGTASIVHNLGCSPPRGRRVFAAAAELVPVAGRRRCSPPRRRRVFAAKSSQRNWGYLLGLCSPPRRRRVFAARCPSTRTRGAPPSVRLLDGGAYLRRTGPDVAHLAPRRCSPPRRRRVFAASGSSRRAPRRRSRVRLLDGGAYLRLSRRNFAPPSPPGVRLLDGGAYLRLRALLHPVVRARRVFASSTEARICGKNGTPAAFPIASVFASSTEARICGVRIDCACGSFQTGVRLLDGGAYLRRRDDVLDVLGGTDRVFASSTEARICGLAMAEGADAGSRVFASSTEARICGRLTLRWTLSWTPCSPPRRRRVFAATLVPWLITLRLRRVFASSTEARICGSAFSASARACLAGVRLLEGGAYCGRAHAGASCRGRRRCSPAPRRRVLAARSSTNAPRGCGHGVRPVRGGAYSRPPFVCIVAMRPDQLFALP